jgi:hypothetical protein
VRRKVAGSWYVFYIACLSFLLRIFEGSSEASTPFTISQTIVSPSQILKNASIPIRLALVAHGLTLPICPSHQLCKEHNMLMVDVFSPPNVPDYAPVCPSTHLSLIEIDISHYT